MPHYTNVSGRPQRQPDGTSWAPGAVHEWPEAEVRDLLLYRHLRAAAAPVPEPTPEPAPAPAPAAPEDPQPPEAEDKPRKRRTHPKEDQL